MNKKYIAGIIVAVLVVGGVVTYITTKDNTSENNNTQTAQETQASQNNDSGAVFNAVANSNVPFEAKMTGQGEANYEATLQYDGQGNSSYSSDYGSGPVKMYMFGDEYISCFGDTCMRLPNSGSDSVANTKRSYSEAELNEFRNSATLKQSGVACGNETCNVWDVKTDGFTGVFYLDSQGRMQKVEGTAGSNTWIIEYTYKPVEITRPANVVSSPL